MHRTHLPAGAYWSAELDWAQDDSPRPLFWWSDSGLHLKSHLAFPLVPGLLMKLCVAACTARGNTIPKVDTKHVFFSSSQYISLPLYQKRFDLSVAGIQSRRSRVPPFSRVKSEWVATAWKLTESAPCTLSNVYRHCTSLHQGKKMLRTQKTADLQKAEAAGQVASSNPGFPFWGSSGQKVTEASIDNFHKTDPDIWYEPVGNTFLFLLHPTFTKG